MTRDATSADKTFLAQKTAVRFAKSGAGIYHSHHDMIRFWERAARRAGLPMRLTQGFNPRPRMVFPHALGLGVVSRHEEVELEFHAPMKLDEVLSRLKDACVGTLEILSASALPPSRKSRQIRESSYLLTGWPGETVRVLPEAAAAVMARDEIRLTRGAPGQRREVDIRPFLEELSFDAGQRAVVARFRHDASGSARLDEIAKLLAEAVGCDWRSIGLEKTGMTLDF